MTNFILLLTTIAFAQENSTPESSDEQGTEEEISEESEKTEEVEESEEDTSEESEEESEQEESEQEESEQEESEQEESSVPSTIVPAEINTNNAQKLDKMRRKDFKFFNPQPKNLPQNPYYNKDFTAYTLEFGELWLGPTFAKAGVTPHWNIGPLHTSVHVGTLPLLWAANIYNYDVKWNAIRLGDEDTKQGLDIALTYNNLYTPTAGLDVSNKSMGVMISARPFSKMTIHLGLSNSVLDIDGTPDFTKLNPLIESTMGKSDTFDKFQDKLDSDESSLFTGKVDLTTIEANIDYRKNRRDSWILQSQATVRSSVQASSNIMDKAELPPILNLDELIALDNQQEATIDNVDLIKNSYIVSLSRQWSGKRSDFRLGLGYSAYGAFPFNLVTPIFTQSTVSWTYRFGGESRLEERKLRKSYKKNKKALRRDGELKNAEKNLKQEQKEIEKMKEIEEEIRSETPAEETSVEETSVEETPAEVTPVEETPVEETPVEETPVEDTSVEENSTPE